MRKPLWSVCEKSKREKRQSLDESRSGFLSPLANLISEAL